jgi:hypothetical protein
MISGTPHLSMAGLRVEIRYLPDPAGFEQMSAPRSSTLGGRPTSPPDSIERFLVRTIALTDNRQQLWHAADMPCVTGVGQPSPRNLGNHGGDSSRGVG